MPTTRSWRQWPSSAPFTRREYAQPVQELDRGLPGIVASHTLIPEALYHAFATFGALMSPELPLQRRQHEMIATMVSLTNKCHY
jgi:alkylhydroperoxidase family enzyme